MGANIHMGRGMGPVRQPSLPSPTMGHGPHPNPRLDARRRYVGTGRVLPSSSRTFRSATPSRRARLKHGPGLCRGLVVHASHACRHGRVDASLPFERAGRSWNAWRTPPRDVWFEGLLEAVSGPVASATPDDKQRMAALGGKYAVRGVPDQS